MTGRDEELFDRLRALGATDDDLEWAAASIGHSDLIASLVLRPGPPVLTLAQVAGRAGIDVEVAARLHEALGFARPDLDAVVFAEAEVEMFRLFALAVDELFGAEATIGLARVIGLGLARIAEAELAAVRVGFEGPMRRAGASNTDVALRIAGTIDAVMPLLARTLDAVHRRHLVDASFRQWEPDDDWSAATAACTVGFADLVGFTAATGALGSAALASAVARFEEHAAVAIGAHAGRLVKLIGDEVMFVADDPRGGAAIAVALRDRVEADPALTSVRVGLAHGRVVTRDGDYFGPTVNLAARLVKAAEAGAVLVDHPVDGAVPAGDLELAGFDRAVAAWTLRPT